MLDLDISGDDLIKALLTLSESGVACILDSCGVSHLGSHLLIAGIAPTDTTFIAGLSAKETLDRFAELTAESGLVSFFTISYGIGLKIQGIRSDRPEPNEPDIFLARFDALIVHDYDIGRTTLTGNPKRAELLQIKPPDIDNAPIEPCFARSNMSKAEYLHAVEAIRENIRDGDTYQANLTHRLECRLPATTSPQMIFSRLRSRHPAPFAAFFTRGDSAVVSGSPERFFRLTNSGRRITTSPIKGTRKRGANDVEDTKLRQELTESGKDRAENTMIVDLLRNDLGRICEFGSVAAEKLCDLEEHPSLFHLVSTVSGRLRRDVGIADVLLAMFPCGSITGAPKISTMKIIDATEPDPRGLSMGAIGYSLPDDSFGLPAGIDMSVAIRTMVVHGRTATFNVGGGIVIDSDPESEYLETLTKAAALLDGLDARFVAD
jgi:para-aminobenzoate synthetase component 1